MEYFWISNDDGSVEGVIEVSSREDNAPNGLILNGEAVILREGKYTIHQGFVEEKQVVGDADYLIWDTWRNIAKYGSATF